MNESVRSGKQKCTEIFVYFPTCNIEIQTCSGSTWQNMEIFSFTAISIGFALLQTIYHNKKKNFKHLLGKPIEDPQYFIEKLISFGSRASTNVTFFSLFPLFWSSMISHSSQISTSKAEINQSLAHTDQFSFIFHWHSL